MKQSLWLCRHGETEWNTEHRKQGHKDSPLTAQGLKQADELASFFRSIEGRLFSSSLGRAEKTARRIYVSNPELGLFVDDRLKEISFGDLEGHTASEIAVEFPDIVGSFCRDPFENGFPNGESYEDLEKRAESFLEEIRELAIRNIIVVAHEDINRLLLTSQLQLDRSQAITISQPNNVIYRTNGENVRAFKMDGTVISESLLTKHI